MIDRAPLRYHGGKWRVAEKIIACFPPHECYVEAFGGGAGVLLRKNPSTLEIYNDLADDVVNFFRVLREQPRALIAAIDMTPYSRRELELAHGYADDPVERARRFYVRSWQDWHAARPAHTPGAWRSMHRPTRRPFVYDWDDTHHLLQVAARLKHVQIEHRPALDVIQQRDTPDTLFYLDPPYLASTRSDRWAYHGYTIDMAAERRHRDLARLLHGIKGMVVLSGYPSDLYADLYRGWECITFDMHDNAGQRRQECLWLNRAASRRRLPLLALIGA